MNLSDSRTGLFSRVRIRPGLAFALIILAALFAFEMFNYSTTEYALKDLLGSLQFMQIPWATILSVAFCGIDFAGIARLFTPEQGADEPKEVWYLFGAWLLAAAMNAVLTWWGVSVAVRNHQELSTSIIGRSTIINVVPVFVALMVWLIRVFIIGTISMAGDRLFSLAEARPARLGNSFRTNALHQPFRSAVLPRPSQPSPVPFRPAPKPEPAYHPVGMTASPPNVEHALRK